MGSTGRRIEVAIIWFYATNERRTTSRRAMKTSKTPIGVLTAMLLIALALPAASTAEEAIPPGNSAVNQYTESLPTGSGQADTEKGGQKSPRSPDNALGARNVEQLEAHGADGRAAAKAAAETAPSASVATPDEGDNEAVISPAATNNGNGSGGGGGAAADSDRKPAGGGQSADGGKAVLAGAQIEEPSGSSGLGEALGEATGASATGQMGWLLPLLILATAIWAFAYAMRQRRRVG
jgi:hypothetical protein